MTALAPRELTREGADARRAPVRIVHLGLGNFFRAHQAWYTALAGDASEWGIAAFTGRTATMARLLDSQESLYCLVVRGAEGDDVEVIPSITRAHWGENLSALRAYAASPDLAIITLTVTEAAYLLDGEGRPMLDRPAVREDIAAARAGESVSTPVGRLVMALDARRAAEAGPIAVVPCDNVPGNGPWLRTGVLAWAAEVDASLAGWIEEHVSFVSTSVDRITPRAGAEVSAAVREAGWIDRAPVVTEPYSAWVLEGDFPAGRPRWEDAGARFVDDVEPYERRKLWLLNGAHSMLAAAGIVAGHETVAQATADAQLWSSVEAFWDEAARHLPEGLDLDVYRADLKERFLNPRMRHLLPQIATDAVTKLRVRVVPVAAAERADGRSGAACARAIASWIDSLAVESGATDSEQPSIDEALASADTVVALTALLSEALAADADFLAAVRAATTTTTAHAAL